MKKRIIKIAVILLVVGTLAIIGVYLYVFKTPHRDVQSSGIDFELSSTNLVNEYLNFPSQSNEKYLQEEGQSKILAVEGTVRAIAQNLEGNFVILLQDETPAGVRCTFTTDSNDIASRLKEGQKVTIKGVIRAGAIYDEDLALYEDVILDKCDII